MEHPTRSQWRQAWPGESPHQSGPAPCPHPIRPQSRPGSTAGRRGGEEVRRAHRPGGPETLGIYVTANRGYQTGRIPSRTPNPQYSKEANLPIQPPPLITTTDTHNQRHGSHPTPPPDTKITSSVRRGNEPGCTSAGSSGPPPGPDPPAARSRGTARSASSRRGSLAKRKELRTRVSAKMASRPLQMTPANLPANPPDTKNRVAFSSSITDTTPGCVWKR